jgi:hypothetical protein
VEPPLSLPPFGNGHSSKRPQLGQQIDLITQDEAAAYGYTMADTPLHDHAAAEHYIFELIIQLRRTVAGVS